jgi:hypothetical protein
MIAALLALSIAVTPGARIIEVPEPGVGYVSIAAVFKLPQLESLGRASADVLAQVVTNDNDKYSKQEMRDLCIPGGQPKCYAMPDHMTIELSVLPADTGAGMRMLAAMVSSARMDVGVMNSYLLSEPYRHRSVWPLALDGQDRAWDRLRATDISNLYHWVFRPDNITVAIGGDVREGQAQAEWDDVSKNWKRQVTAPLRQSVPFKDFPLSFPSHVLELRGPEFMPDDKAMPAKLLALMALGSGKSSSLFQDIREKKAWSYRQEAVLWPTHDGFVPRWLIQIRPLAPDAETKLITDIRVALLSDISGWDDSVLQRAQGYGSALAKNGADFSPFYFRPSGPLGMSVEDRTLLAAYWQMKAGSHWNGDALAEQFKTVDLATMKDVATNMVKIAFPVIHPTGKS